MVFVASKIILGQFSTVVTDENPHWPAKDDDSDSTASVHDPPKDNPLPDLDPVDDLFGKRFCKLIFYSIY